MDSKRLRDGRWLRVKATKRREVPAEGRRKAYSQPLGEMSLSVRLTGDDEPHRSVFSRCPLPPKAREQIRAGIETAERGAFELDGWAYEWEVVDAEDGSNG